MKNEFWEKIIAKQAAEIGRGEGERERNEVGMKLKCGGNANSAPNEILIKFTRCSHEIRVVVVDVLERERQGKRAKLSWALLLLLLDRERERESFASTFSPEKVKCGVAGGEFSNVHLLCLWKFLLWKGYSYIS
jgi:hypothetical protein